MAGFSVSFDYKSNGADVAKMDASALNDLAEQLDKVAGSTSAAETGTAESLQKFAAQIRTMADDARDVPMALVGGLEKAKPAVDEDLVEPLAKVAPAAKEAGKGYDELQRTGQSALSNLGFSSAQIAGSLGSGPGGLLESLGESAAYMALDGPFGAAIAGVGGLIAVLGAKWQESKQEEKQAQEDMLKQTQTFYDEMIAAGTTYLTKSSISDNIKKIGDDTKQYAQAQDVAGASGAKLSTVIRAMAGDQEALSEVQGRLTKKLDDAGFSAVATAAANGTLGDSAEDLDGPLSKAATALESVTSTGTAAAEKAGHVEDALKNVGNSSTGASKGLDGVKTSLDNLPDKVTVDVELNFPADNVVTGWRNRAQGLLNQGIAVPVSTGRAVL